MAAGEVPGPCVCRFLGIVIAVFYDDHAPPHFHARYGEHRALSSIDELSLLEGELPRRVAALVVEWAFMHRPELRRNWEFAQAGLPLEPIAPLE